ncbi:AMINOPEPTIDASE (DUF3754) [Salix koriyanagi]|uniref:AMINOPEPTIDASE (DUF3754) n=1 Tax=Salix koriyanagi TaxID=2511006 RepID=A0A9Q0U572_9ROSI|nr:AMINOPEPTIDASE (DUF3754) [Salix koriyanagi]
MADMEIVLVSSLFTCSIVVVAIVFSRKEKSPGLTPVDWVKFIVSAVIGLITVIGSLSNPKADIRVILAILTSVVGYCVKTYFTLSVFFFIILAILTVERGTLLHLCDDVIQQEVKEVIVSFFILMVQGEATRQELDRRCEELITGEFNEKCNFDVDDALQKLQKLGIVAKDPAGKYACTDLKRANEIIGTTTEEVVLKANQGDCSFGR